MEKKVMETKKNNMSTFNIKEFLIQNAIYFVLAALLVVIIIKEPSFLSIVNFTSIFIKRLCWYR